MVLGGAKLLLVEVCNRDGSSLVPSFWIGQSKQTAGPRLVVPVGAAGSGVLSFPPPALAS
jgi:hypothetical protein